MNKTLQHSLVIFDWDGTLMNSQAKIVNSMQKAAEAAELEVLEAAAIRHIIGLGLPEAIAALYPNLSAESSACVAEKYAHFFIHDQSVPCGLFEYADQLLHYLAQQGRQLAIATGKSRRGLDRVLSETGVGDYFHASRCADESGSKPHPAMVLEILSELGVKPADAVMVGDTIYDLEMAQAAGVDRVGVTYGSHNRHQLHAFSPLAVVDSVSELLDCF